MTEQMNQLHDLDILCVYRANYMLKGHLHEKLHNMFVWFDLVKNNK